MAFRFVHTADIHLDSPLRTLALREPELAGLIGGATRKAFVAIVDLCLAEQVDALIIAGDLYDGEQTSMKTARFLADQLRRLHQAAIAVFIIRGNHDAESRITRELTLPDSVKVFAGRAEAVVLCRGGLDVAVHGVSFAQKHAPESLLARFRGPCEGAVNVGMLHTSLGGSPSHDLYAPCQPAELHGAGFDYWALGHIHQRFEERGRATIVMPGNPQGRDINEAGPKTATLVTIGDNGAISLEERPTSVAEFQRVGVDLGGVEDWRAALKRIETALGSARLSAKSQHLVARLKLRGATPLAFRLRSDADKLREDVAGVGAAVGKTWIDKIELTCVEPEASGAAPSSDPVAELRALMEREVAQSKAFQDGLRDMAEDLSGHLPQELRKALFGRDTEEFAEILRAVASEGAEDVLAHLRAADRDPRP
jgi:exonuclease SbcD